MSVERISAEQFFSDLHSFKDFPVFQSEGWVKSRLAIGKDYEFFATSAKDFRAIVAAEVTKIPVIGKILRINGGVVFDGPLGYQKITPFLEELCSDYSYVELVSSQKLDPLLEVEVRRAGFLRPIWGRSCPMTVEVDCANPNPNRNWRRNSRKAKKNGLQSPQCIITPSTEQIKQVMALFEETSKVKPNMYVPTETELAGLLADESMRLYLVEDEEGPLAARVIWVSNERAYDIYNCIAIRGRDLGVSHMMMLDIFEGLAEENVKTMDLGRIGPGKTNHDSVFTYKYGSGGALVAYCGEWIRYSKIWDALTVAFYLGFVKRAQRW